MIKSRKERYQRELFLTTLLVSILGFDIQNLDASAAVRQNGGSRQTINIPTTAPQPAPCLIWKDPQVPPRAALLCVHGLGLHKGTFAEFGRQMCKIGFITYALDMRGFGEYVEKREHPQLDFDGCLADIKSALQQIHKDNPGIPVVILGESMGGAIALRATALYPDLISGLISSVPAGDRFSLGDAETKATLHAIFGGMNKPIPDVGEAVVDRATMKPELRTRWKSDPLVRLEFTPNELLQFNSFMKKNFEVAKAIKNTPVLFIQGANDRLVRPAGTWKLFDRMATSKRQLVLSKTSEHLIFEEGQFSSDDLNFVTSWLDRNVISMATNPVEGRDKLPAAPSNSTSSSASTPPSLSSTAASTATITATVPSTATVAGQPNAPAMVNYWIELYRNGKLYRCNNKMEFKTGDVIRFHLIPANDGYAYLVMTAGTSGKSQVLFPNAKAGTDNFLRKGQDYPMPTLGWLEFDKTPGTEKLKLVFSSEPIKIKEDAIEERYVTCYVSPDSNGAKDLIPTRMKLSWSDPKPVLIPDDFVGSSQIDSTTASSSSLVRVVSNGSIASKAILSADIALKHY